MQQGESPCGEARSFSQLNYPPTSITHSFVRGYTPVINLGVATQVFTDEDVILWRKFDGLPPIPGYLTNLVVMLRQRFVSDGQSSEPSVSDVIFDVSNTEEKKVTTEVCRHLLNNGVQDFQLLSNFPDYAKAVATELNKYKLELGVGSIVTEPFEISPATEDSIDVTIVLLLSCNGRWQQQRMFSMVRDAYNASRLGVIILGNSSIVQNISDPKWQNYVTTLEKGTGWSDHFQIVCHRHRVINSSIVTAGDFRKQSPMGGCHYCCGEMDCGHRCPFPCHPVDPDHVTEDFKCVLPCKRTCPSGHFCKEACCNDCGLCFAVIINCSSCEHSVNKEKQMFCFQRSKEKCMVPVKKKLPCGHLATLSCSVDAATYRCSKKLGGVLKCGHEYMFYCWENLDPNQEIECQMLRTHKFPCGHEIIGVCAEISQQGVDLKCTHKCDRELKCGHYCGRECHFNEDPDHEQFKCQEPCKRLCKRKVHSCASRNGHLCSDPCPPCKEPFVYPLPCGHMEPIICGHPDPDQDNNYFCKQKCIKMQRCMHPCNKACGEDCGLCETLVPKTVIGCSRGHTQLVPCHAQRPSYCRQQVVPKAFPECGHKIKVNCTEADSITIAELANRCTEPCFKRYDKEGECGHICRGTCRDCFQGRLHMRCQESCGKTLICGHSCTSPCANACPPCRYSCFNTCEHAKCKFECGVPCERDCEQPCVYACEHSVCTNKCSEVCNKKICNEPCWETLECGHDCMGFCGEKCPPLCGTCTPEKLLQGVFTGSTELNPELRFIYLPDCGHCIESESLENWLGVQTEEIMPIKCPLCQTRISWIRRYSNVFQENFKLINSIRAKIFGNTEEIELIVQDLHDRVTAHVQEAEQKPYFPEYASYIQHELDVPRFSEPNPDNSVFSSMSIHKARFLDWVATEWIHGSEILKQHRGKLHTPFYKKLTEFWKEYFVDMIAERVWPMHPNEIIAMEQERKRMDDTVAIYTRLIHNPGSKLRQLLTSYGGMRLFRKTEELIRRNQPYDEETRIQFGIHLKELDALMNCTIDLSDTERRQIVYAFGEGSGRWFKCVNGHVYVVTECGGATERGHCNECGAVIGGQNHVLEEENYLATEMDGAEQPLYPTVLLRPNADA